MLNFVCMIEAVVLDYDGVVGGTVKGYNDVIPSPNAIKKLLELEKSIPVVFVTAMPSFRFMKLASDIGIGSVHVLDGGSVDYDASLDKIIRQDTIENSMAKKAVDLFVKNNFYTEVYTAHGYSVQKDNLSDITERHGGVNGSQPDIVENLASDIEGKDITKIISTVTRGDIAKADQLESLFNRFDKDIYSYWAQHPSFKNTSFMVGVPQGVSKSVALQGVAKLLDIDLKKVLAGGDSNSDRGFMELCGFKFAMDNGQDDLKKWVAGLGENGFVAPHVNEDGALAAFKNFDL